MKLVYNIKNTDTAVLQLKNGRRTLDELHLTVSQGFDSMLITAIDKLLIRNRIDRLSLKSLEIQGEIRPEAVSSMIIRALKSAIEV